MKDSRLEAVAFDDRLRQLGVIVDPVDLEPGCSQAILKVAAVDPHVVVLSEVTLALLGRE